MNSTPLNTAPAVASPKEKPLKWHVMTHLDMSDFRMWFDYVNAERMRDEQPIIQAFFPYEFLKGRTTETADASAHDKKRVEAMRGVQNALKRFVFLRSTDDDIKTLIYSKANLQSRVRLCRYLTPSGDQAYVRDALMSDFLRNCIDYRERFELAPSGKKHINVADSVRIKTGPYKGYEAKVERVKLKSGKLLLDLSIPMVSGQIDIRMREVRASDVKTCNKATAGSLRQDFIRYTQDNLLDILTRRAEQIERAERERKQARRAATSAALDDNLSERQKLKLQPFADDSDMLERLMRYRDYEISGTWANAHFKALMLICAHLCKDITSERALTQTVRGLLHEDAATGDFTVRTDAEAYLCVALKVATNAPVYRDKVKEYMRQHQPRSRRLHDFVALIRKDVKY